MKTNKYGFIQAEPIILYPTANGWSVRAINGNLLLEKVGRGETRRFATMKNLLEFVEEHLTRTDAGVTAKR